MKKRSEAWRAIWEKKYASRLPADPSQPDARQEPHVRDGFDSLSLGQWKKLAGYFLPKIAVGSGDDVLEVGCGAGAFLGLLPPCSSIAGVDFSENAILRAKSELSGDFRVSGAASLPFADKSFDVVMSWSVFFYFDSLEYAKEALDEMVRVLRRGGRIFVGDVNDLSKKALALKLRDKSGAERRNRWVTGGRSADHLYYPKEFFREYAKTRMMSVRFFDEDVEELVFYENSRFRYSLVMKRT
ncbi:MAG: class I SAM-dependent methyltransferase [Spirochaetes bacterium]|nr:class I SAM-dependent methyltransferase [Spirochaetota bacterium]